MPENQELINALNRIEKQLETHLAAQKKALDLQREQFELVQKQFVRTEKLQDRAEKLQESGWAIMSIARKSLVIILPIIIVLIIYLSWLIFR